MDVFLSVGRTSTPEQNTFLLALESLLAKNQLRPRTVGRTDFVAQKPLKTILEVMQQCSGTVVVAFERFHFDQGAEYPNSPNSTSLENIYLPTVWNQVEAAMAYSLGQPLLAIANSKLRNEGLLEEGYDWFVKWLEFTPESLDDPAFLSTFLVWGENVKAYQAAKK
jgi:hypothetical protein